MQFYLLSFLVRLFSCRLFFYSHSKTLVTEKSALHIKCQADFFCPIKKRLFQNGRSQMRMILISARGRQCESEVQTRWCCPRHCTKPSGVCQVFFSHSVKLVPEGQVFVTTPPGRRSAKLKNNANGGRRRL